MKSTLLFSVLLVIALRTSSTAASCDCKPTFLCPQARTSGNLRSCRLRGYLRGYCCPPSGGGGSGTSRPRRDCTPLVLCPAALADPASFGGQKCQLADGSTGVMCSGAGATIVNRIAGGSRTATRPLSGDRVITESFMAVTGGDVQSAARAADRAVADQVRLNNRLLTAGSTPARDSAVSIFNLNFRSSQSTQDLGLQALRSLRTLTNIDSQGSAPGQMVTLVSRFGNSGGEFSSSQPIRVPDCVNEDPIFCTRSLYRATNGECNNLQRPRQGRALTGFKRLFENTYADGIFSIRSTSVTGRSLPSARLVSERVVESISQELQGFTLSLMQWGQFIDHDFNHALVFRLGDAAIECCQNGGQTLPSTPLHPQCIPIPIPANDPFYSQFGQRCMSLVRSIPAPEPDCIGRPATPINELTSYLDASNLYGSEQGQQDGLRTFRDGLLTTSGNNMLPLRSTPRVPRPDSAIRFPGSQTPTETDTEPGGESCRQEASVCFRGGESRVNEQSALTVMHTIFTREHNRIARALKRVHRSWEDERLFQEARRIVIGEWQHIIYNEWLPIIVGRDFARDHGLQALQRGFSNSYDTTIDATSSNEFATAAFRFGHSLLREMYDLVAASGQVVQSVNVTRTFFNPTVVSQRLVEHARTLVASRPETFDSNIIRGVHEQLFTSNFRFGLDLIALNVQRGRDHGIPTYATVLKACTGITLARWSDLNRIMDPSNIDQLRSVYDDPRDVDLFIGGLAERRSPGAQVGPTFQCLIGQEFFDLRFGDRFFYDNGNQPHSFSERQLTEIRKSSWARMMCDTLGLEFGNDFSRVQPLAFVEQGVGPNDVSSCSSQAIPSMDLSVF